MSRSQPQGIDAGGDRGLQALGSAVAVTTRILFGALCILLLVSLLRCYVIVKQHQVGRVYRFGRLVRELGPGEHAVVFPPPIDEVRTYSVTREQSLSTDAFLYAVSEAEERTGTAGLIPASLKPGVDGYLLTGDRHIVHCRAELYYRVSDPVAFHEAYTDGTEALRALLHASLVRAGAGRATDTVLFDLTVFSEAVLSELRGLAERAALGVEVNRLTLKTMPPRQVKEAFDAHVAAGQGADQRKQEADAYHVRTLNEADVTADRIVSSARAERTMLIEQARARANTFSKLLVQYREMGDVVKDELHHAALRRVLGQVGEVFLAEEGNGRQLRLLVGRHGAARNEGAGPPAGEDGADE